MHGSTPKRKSKKSFFNGLFAGGKRSPAIERLEARELLSITPNEPQAAPGGTPPAFVLVGPPVPAALDNSHQVSPVFVANTTTGRCHGWLLLYALLLVGDLGLRRAHLLHTHF